MPRWPPSEPAGDFDNDDRMRSLIEVSRETGIPMPVILRLQREHPDRVPSVGVGSGQFFPEGVIGEIRALAEAEGVSAGRGDGQGRALLSLPRRRPAPGAAPAAASVPASPTPPDPPDPEGRRGRRRTSRTDSDTAALARRLERLEEAQRRLTEELARVLVEVRRPWVGRGPRS